VSSPEDSAFEPGIVPSQRPGKTGGARERNRQARTQALCEAALALFLRRGVESATVEEITRHAGVAKGSFYRYFSDKAQLVEALFSPVERALDEAMQRCQRSLSQATQTQQLNDAYATLASELSQVLMASPLLVKLYLQERRGPAEGARVPIRRLADRLTGGAVTLTEVAHARGLLRELPPAVTAVAVIGAVEGIVCEYLDGRALGDPERTTAILITMVLDGIRRLPIER
jgi:AcrR family transcriptional regulator